MSMSDADTKVAVAINKMVAEVGIQVGVICFVSTEERKPGETTKVITAFLAGKRLAEFTYADIIRLGSSTCRALADQCEREDKSAWAALLACASILGEEVGAASPEHTLIGRVGGGTDGNP